MYLQLGVVFVTLFQIVITEKCVTPNNEEAKCVSIYSCKILLDALETKQSDIIEFVRKSKCEGRESDRMVCCGSTSRFLTPTTYKNADKDKLIPARTYCGYQHSDDYFRNKSAVGINEFPWMAGLVYKQKNGNGTAILCTGSLITNRYVLTAAHCIFPKPEMYLVGVRLGEYNTKTDEDCTEDANFYECSDSPENFDIERKIPHLQYNIRPGAHDISLLRLSKKVQYSDYIRPICLPTAGTMFAKPGDIMYTSGWGREHAGDRFTNRKKKISTKLITNEECIAEHKIYKNIINENYLCTKKLQATTEYSCIGDGGGPLIFSHRNQWHQEGIVTYGGCDSGNPDVYIKVFKYLDWIKENIEP